MVKGNDFEMLVQIFSVLGTFIGLYFIYKQYRISNRQSKEMIEQTNAMNKQNDIQKDNIRREKALEMASYFMTLLEKEITVISSILEQFDINKWLAGKEYSDFEFFDNDEVTKKLKITLDDIEKMYSGIDNKKLSIIANTYLLSNDLNTDEIKKILLFDSLEWSKEKLIESLTTKIDEIDDNQNEKLKIMSNEILMEMAIYRQMLENYYIKTRTNLLNKLEYFAMYFNCNLADEKVVYQSLHQVYLSIVEELYCFIAYKNNSDGKDKFYTNLIDLYNIWAKRDDEYKKKSISINRTQRLKAEYPD